MPSRGSEYDDPDWEPPEISEEDYLWLTRDRSLDPNSEEASSTPAGGTASSSSAGPGPSGGSGPGRGDWAEPEEEPGIVPDPLLLYGIRPDISRRFYVVYKCPRGQEIILGIWTGLGVSAWDRIRARLRGGRLEGSGVSLKRHYSWAESWNAWQGHASTVESGLPRFPVVHNIHG
jgi:hypothetical protein